MSGQRLFCAASILVLLVMSIALVDAAQEGKKKGAQREAGKSSSPKKATAKAPSGEEVVRSGPAIGEVLPGSFAPFNINGKRKDTYHCLVCDYGVVPVVMVFAREPAEGKEAGLNELLKALDMAVDRHQKAFLHAFVVFLTADAPASPAEGETADKLVKEAGAREALRQRLQASADKLKNIVISYFPAEGPKDYKINPDAEVTVLFYRSLKVEANWAFRPGELRSTDAGRIVTTIDDKLARSKLPAATK